MRVSQWFAGRVQRCYFLVPFLHFALCVALFRLRGSLKLQESSTQSLIETVVIPPVSRKEVNFKHVSRQERRERKELVFWAPIRGVRGLISLFFFFVVFFKSRFIWIRISLMAAEL